MREKHVFLVALLIIGVAFGCSKVQNNPATTDVEETIQVKDEPVTKVLIKCTGDGCTSGGPCAVTLGSTIREWECCEGCHLTIEFISDPPIEEGGTINDVEDVDNYYEEFDSYLGDVYPNLSYEIESIYYEGNSSIYFLIYYFTLSDGTQESVLLYSPSETSGVYTVDCNGSCTEGECTENAIIHPNGTIDVKCGCEGPNCKMTIETPTNPD